MRTGSGRGGRVRALSVGAVFPSCAGDLRRLAGVFLPRPGRLMGAYAFSISDFAFLARLSAYGRNLGGRGRRDVRFRFRAREKRRRLRERLRVARRRDTALRRLCAVFAVLAGLYALPGCRTRHPGIAGVESAPSDRVRAGRKGARKSDAQCARDTGNATFCSFRRRFFRSAGAFVSPQTPARAKRSPARGGSAVSAAGEGRGVAAPPQWIRSCSGNSC